MNTIFNGNTSYLTNTCGNEKMKHLAFFSEVCIKIIFEE